jgi:hypothetical protein
LRRSASAGDKEDPLILSGIEERELEIGVLTRSIAMTVKVQCADVSRALEARDDATRT